MILLNVHHQIVLNHLKETGYKKKTPPVELCKNKSKSSYFYRSRLQVIGNKSDTILMCK